MKISINNWNNYKENVNDRPDNSNMFEVLIWQPDLQPKALNVLLPLINKEKIERWSEISIEDVKKLINILKESRSYFNELYNKIHNEYRDIDNIPTSSLFIDVNKINVLKKCVLFLGNNEDFKYNNAFNYDHANISNLDNTLDRTITFIKKVEWSKSTSSREVEELNRPITLVIEYLSSLIVKDPPKQAKADIPQPPTPPKKAEAAQPIPPFEPSNKKTGYQPYHPYIPGSSNWPELY